MPLLPFLDNLNNLNYFANRDKSLLQSVISPYDLKPSNIDTATRVTNASSTYMDYIIPGDYETGIIADTILKADHFATITVPKSKNNIASFTILRQLKQLKLFCKARQKSAAICNFSILS